MNLNMIVTTAASTFCADSADIWQFVGQLLLIFKVVIPILLIILGMVDLGRAVVSSDEKAISKAAMSLVKRVAAAIIIFFIPSIIGLVFNMVGGWNTEEIKNDYNVCAKCISSPNGDTCTKYVGEIDSITD